jgi:RsiW-degrading membrane proteinase PrsW (M82 family)
VLFDSFSLPVLLWAVLPPLVVLTYYYLPLQSALAPAKLLLIFCFGGLSGLAALGIARGIELLAQMIFPGEGTLHFLGEVLRQLLQVAPLEEGSKFIAVLLVLGYLGRRNWLIPIQQNTVLLATIAIALGFAAEENFVYLFHHTGTVFSRVVGTPSHAFFSAAWGYALGMPIYRWSGTYKREWRSHLLTAWVGAVFYHALVNSLAIAWHFPVWAWLVYGQFPLILWLFWRTDRFWRQVQGQRPPSLISAATPLQRARQRGLALLILGLGGNALFFWFLLGNRLNVRVGRPAPLPLEQGVQVRLALLGGVQGAIAAGIYAYLRSQANHRRRFKP